MTIEAMAIIAQLCGNSLSPAHCQSEMLRCAKVYEHTEISAASTVNYCVIESDYILLKEGTPMVRDPEVERRRRGGGKE